MSTDDEEIVIDDQLASEGQELSPTMEKIRQITEVLVTTERVGLNLPYTIHPTNGEIAWYPSVEDAVKIAKGLGGKWDKNDPSKSTYDADWLVMSQKRGVLNLKLIVSRGQVCERKVVGTERKKVTKYVEVEVEELVDIVEYDCGSLYSAAEKAAMARLENS